MEKTAPATPVCDLPPLPQDDLAALRESIRRHGVLDPVHVDEDGHIIDGLVRKLIADELGVPCPQKVHTGLGEEEKRALRRSLNLSRRHLTHQQKRELIADQLRDTPGWSNRRIGQALGVSHPTVAAVRQELASTGKITSSPTTEGLDGKARRVRDSEWLEEKEYDLGTLTTVTITGNVAVSDAFLSLLVEGKKVYVCRNWDARASYARARGIMVIIDAEYEEARP